MKYFVFNDPEWDYLKYDFANYRRDSKLAGSMLNATDPNLDAFKKRGGKLVLYHGWSDAALSAMRRQSITNRCGRAMRRPLTSRGCSCCPASRIAAAALVRIASTGIR